MRKRKMQLTKTEQQWLDAYRQALRNEFLDAVEEVLIYGLKARGDAQPDSNLDVPGAVKKIPGKLNVPRERFCVRRDGLYIVASL